MKKEIQKIDNRKTSVFNKLLGRKRSSQEHTEKTVENHDKENSKPKKEIKKIKKIKKRKSSENWYVKVMHIDTERLDKEIEERKKKKKEEEEEKQININQKLQRNLMGNKERKFMTQKEEEEERKKKEQEIKRKINITSNENSLPIPFLNPSKQNFIDKYKSFNPMLNDIYKNVLDFNFYKRDLPLLLFPFLYHFYYYYHLELYSLCLLF